MTKETALQVQKDFWALGDGTPKRPYPGTIHAVALLMRKYKLSAKDVMRAVGIK